ncbi:CaiB/BaiF CoA-transferase family protein [Brevundimonas sp.]|uniref:CaiB/BaiF CoA transferase family protein n=1 Tax=Brevundimonas sp. TaxID=1871086 RepID=UPI0025E18520|nr:CaiB/BaiF CoA-transferase family protein [Brevundimonas sp.]
MGQGPLSGVRVVEFAGIGPAPFAVMLLADMGAEVVRIDRSPADPFPNPVVNRGRTSILLDLKSEEGRRVALDAIAAADVLIEGYRPGVMERLGLGPDEALARNPRLIYGRMTGWGQDGPLSQRAGHDINYIALTGALDAIGPAEGPPMPPLNLVGDYGGGALYLVMGVCAALYERERSGKGQVIDAAVVDGTASLMALFHGFAKGGLISTERGRRALGGDAPWYRTYECADGRFISVGPVEPHFQAELLQRLELDPAEVGSLLDPRDWPRAHAAMERVFLTRTRDAWAQAFADSDACVAPVLTMAEAPTHAHMASRGVYEERDGEVHPAAAPRLSRTPGRAAPTEASAPGEGGAAALARWGVRVSQ